MTNASHLEMLRRGMEVWDKWRSEYKDVQPNLIRARLANEDLSKADLRGADLSRADLTGADLSEAHLTGVRLTGADLTGAKLVSASLFGADLRSAKLIGADLSDADLSDAHLNATVLTGADFSRAYLGDTDFSNADLNGANFTEAVLNNATFGGNDLSQVKGLETVHHDGPSHLSIETIYISQGNIPEIFLRGCGVPENFITYMHTLAGKALGFYKCFISFTEADDAFSERLYNDLQAKDVRCWRWKEDAKWGKTLMRSIDEAVRTYDKLIVICSEQSLNSPAVIREIERALQKEDELARGGQESEVLFPIRLDDYIFTGWQHYRKIDVTAKTVGDFRGWKDHDAYQKAFDRLLQDLKAEEAKP